VRHKVLRYAARTEYERLKKIEEEKHKNLLDYAYLQIQKACGL
jgi:hypothetical protein